jgi:integrase
VTQSRHRYQTGSLIKRTRAHGPSEWILRYRVTQGDGRRVQPQAVVGTTEELRTKSQAETAADEVRLTINNLCPALTAPTVGTVARHFKDSELTETDTHRSYPTKVNYQDTLDSYILPRWEETRMSDVKTVAVEQWLASLTWIKDPGRPLADPTKQKIRNVFSVLYTHAQRYELVPAGFNPIKLVRQSGKRSRVPDLLTAGEINAIWTESEPREQAAISIEYGNGLRITEAFGLRWSDIDFKKGAAWVLRTVSKGHVGETKTEVSKKLVPLHPYQLKDLKAWRAVASYPEDDAWLFASHHAKGTKPYYPDTMLKRHVQRTAKRLGITKNIGWRTFRRTFASLLKANGEDVKVVQELMRHANPNTTMGLYAQAFTEDVRKAQGKVVEMVRRAPLPPRKPAQNAAVGA